jgi:hypothetical protein
LAADIRLKPMTLDEIYKTGPIVTIVALFIAYIIWIFQKKHEVKLEFHKTIRFATSNILLIWKEFSKVESRLKSTDEYDKILFKYPGLAKNYFKIDSKKIAFLNKNFEDSLNVLKNVNVDLFFRFSNSYDAFRRTVDEVLIPIINDETVNEKAREEILIPLLEANMDELEILIEEIVLYLPFFQQKKILSHINTYKKHEVDIKDIYLPDFIVSFINKSLPFVEEVSKDEILLLYSNPFLSKLMLKFDLSIFLKIIGKNPLQIIKFLIKLKDRNILELHSLEKKIDSIDFSKLILDLELDDDDLKLLIKNKSLYTLILGVIYKFEKKVPYLLKRNLIRLNNGEFDFKEELNKLKIEVVKQNQLNTK